MQPVRGSLSPDVALLQLCARPVATADVTARMAGLAREVGDGERLLRLAEWHGLVPLLHARLGSQSLAGIGARLKNGYVATTARNARLLAEWRRLHAALTAAGVPVLPFKGPVLAAQLYGDIGLRRSSDLDLMVPRPHILAAREALLQAGYRPQVDLRGRELAAYLRTGQDWMFRHPVRGIFVDVNATVASHTMSRPSDVERMLERSRSFALEGTAFRVAAAEDTLVALCVHAARHAWDQMNMVADVARLAADGVLDWSGVRAVADTWRTRRILHLGLLLARDVAGVALPDAVAVAAGADAGARALARRVRARWHAGMAGPPSQAATWRFCLAAREDARDRLRFVWRELCVPSYLDRAAVPLPAALWPLYAVIRPCRLAVAFAIRPRKGELAAARP